MDPQSRARPAVSDSTSTTTVRSGTKLPHRGDAKRPHEIGIESVATSLVDELAAYNAAIIGQPAPKFTPKNVCGRRTKVPDSPTGCDMSADAARWRRL